jgi:hypothetical protein
MSLLHIADSNVFVRDTAVYSLASMGGDKARDLLLRQLTIENDRGVLDTISKWLKNDYPGDSAVEKALKNFKPPSPPKGDSTAEPEPARSDTGE